jgi:hypothetical protein
MDVIFYLVGFSFVMLAGFYGWACLGGEGLYDGGRGSQFWHEPSVVKQADDTDSRW